MEAARWAPSCYGDQPWRYVVGDRFADPDGWEAILGCLAEQNRRWARHAPLLIAACADTRFDFNGEPNRWGAYDTGAASENLCLQATALGLAAHQMGGFDPAALRQAVGIPERFEPMAVIAVGHPAAPERLEPGLREMEVAQRARRHAKQPAPPSVTRRSVRLDPAKASKRQPPVARAPESRTITPSSLRRPSTTAWSPRRASRRSKTSVAPSG